MSFGESGYHARYRTSLVLCFKKPPRGASCNCIVPCPRAPVKPGRGGGFPSFSLLIILCFFAYVSSLFFFCTFKGLF